MRYGPVLFRSRAELDAGRAAGDVDRSRRAPGRRGREVRKSSAARPPGHDEEVTRLVRAAANGDQQAWDAIVSRYVALLWSIAFRHGLGESDAADVVQNTWLRLFEHIHDVREPARVGSWLATTAQRESLRIVAQRQRVVPSDDEATFDGADRLQAPLDEALLAREQAAEARAALDTLPPAVALGRGAAHPGPAAVVRADRRRPGRSDRQHRADPRPVRAPVARPRRRRGRPDCVNQLLGGCRLQHRLMSSGLGYHRDRRRAHQDMTAAAAPSEPARPPLTIATTLRPDGISGVQSLRAPAPPLPRRAGDTDHPGDAVLLGSPADGAGVRGACRPQACEHHGEHVLVPLLARGVPVPGAAPPPRGPGRVPRPGPGPSIGARRHARSPRPPSARRDGRALPHLPSGRVRGQGGDQPRRSGLPVDPAGRP